MKNIFHSIQKDSIVEPVLAVRPSSGTTNEKGRGNYKKV
jgi:hypothetical protein